MVVIITPLVAVLKTKILNFDKKKIKKFVSFEKNTTFAIPFEKSTR